MERTNEEKLMGTLNRLKRQEAAYNEMSKEELVKLLVFRDMMDENCCPEEREVTLWYFIADKSEAKYLSDEMPIKYFTPGDSDGIFVTDGEVNIRVPNMLEEILPEMKFGDEPTLVKITVSR